MLNMLFIIFFTAAAIALYFFLKKRADSKGLKIKWFYWAGMALVYLILIMGISFIYLNMDAYHVKAASTGAFVFFVPVIVFGLLLGRKSGLIEFSKRG